MEYKQIVKNVNESEYIDVVNLIHMGWELDSTLIDCDGEPILTKEKEKIVFSKTFNSDESYKLLEAIKKLDNMHCFDDNYFCHSVRYTPVR